MSHALVFPQCLMSQHFHNVSSLTDSTVFWSCLGVSTSHPSIFPPCLILKCFNSVSCLNVSAMSHPWMFPCLLPQCFHNVSSLSVSSLNVSTSPASVFPQCLIPQCFHSVSRCPGCEWSHSCWWHRSTGSSIDRWCRFPEHEKRVWRHLPGEAEAASGRESSIRFVEFWPCSTLQIYNLLIPNQRPLPLCYIPPLANPIHVLYTWTSSLSLSLTPSLPWFHWKTTLKSVNLKPLSLFVFFFALASKGFHQNAQHWKYMLWDPKIHCL